MHSPLCRTILLTNHYKALLVNIEAFQTDSAPFYDYIMEVNKFMGSNSVTSSPVEDPKSPSTAHSDSKSVGPFGEESVGSSSNTKSTAEPLSPHPRLQNNKENPFRLSQLNFDLSYSWSDPKGDELFSEEIRRASDAKKSEEVILTPNQGDKASSTPPPSVRPSSLVLHDAVDRNTVKKGHTSTGEVEIWDEISLQEPSATSPWVEDYHDRMAKTPTKSDFENTPPKYVAWSPRKDESRFDFDIVLTDDLPELQRFDSKQATDPTDQVSSQQETNSINRALLESEPLHFLHPEHEMTEQIDQTPASAIDIPTVVVHSPTEEQDAAPDDAQDADEDGLTEEDYRMLYVQALRSIVANEGGLAALPPVINDEDEKEEDGGK